MQVTNSGPAKLTSSNVSLESNWRNGSRRTDTPQSGLTIVGRQMHWRLVSSTMLAVDVVGPVGRHRDQAGRRLQGYDHPGLDYAPVSRDAHRGTDFEVTSILRQRGGPWTRFCQWVGVPKVERAREVRIFVVARIKAQGWPHRGYLSGTYGIPITVVSYLVFQVQDGQRVLVRELTETRPLRPRPRENSDIGATVPQC